MTTLYEWPRDWYRFTNGAFSLKARSLIASRTWAAGRNVYGPHAQLWSARLTLAPEHWDVRGQAMDAFVSRLDGQASLVRMAHPARVTPQYNRVNPADPDPFSDSTYFDDGTGWWSTGTVPDIVHLASAAARGANFIVVGGLPVSASRVLRRGDLLELRAGGIATATPNLYEVSIDGTTDSQGRTGVEIRPRLRQGFDAGDMVVTSYPMGTFRFIDDDQGEAEVGSDLIARRGFSLIEALA